MSNSVSSFSRSSSMASAHFPPAPSPHFAESESSSSNGESENVCRFTLRNTGVFQEGESSDISPEDATVIFANGDKYQGDLDESGNPHGYGLLVYGNKGVEFFGPNKFAYRGNHCTLWIKSYQGEFKNGKPCGQGIMTFRNGPFTSIEGEFRNGCPVGYIQKRMSYGFYVGQANKRNQPHGRGWLLNDHGHLYRGDFREGKYHGKGYLSWPGDSYYEGDFVNDNRQGSGILRYRNGDVYQGGFLGNFPNGQGTLIKANGSSKSGLFRNGEFEPPIFTMPGQLETLWKNLQKDTQSRLEGLEYCSKNELSHRFAPIRCPKETVVSVNGRYLHANRVGKGISDYSFVALQEPLPQDYGLFWEAVFNEKAVIFDLTTENSLSQMENSYYPLQMEDSYYPQSSMSGQYGAMTVGLYEQQDGLFSYLAENQKTNEAKAIKRYHYPHWPDDSSIDLIELKNLIEKVKIHSENFTVPVWIHCLAGVGRTGTLITAVILEELIKKGKINLENVGESLSQIILLLREQRGPCFVKERTQFLLLYEYAVSLLMEGALSV